MHPYCFLSPGKVVVWNPLTEEFILGKLTQNIIFIVNKIILPPPFLNVLFYLIDPHILMIIALKYVLFSEKGYFLSSFFIFRINFSGLFLL